MQITGCSKLIDKLFIEEALISMYSSPDVCLDELELLFELRIVHKIMFATIVQARSLPSYQIASGFGQSRSRSVCGLLGEKLFGKGEEIGFKMISMSIDVNRPCRYGKGTQGLFDRVKEGHWIPMYRWHTFRGLNPPTNLKADREVIIMSKSTVMMNINPAAGAEREGCC